MKNEPKVDNRSEFEKTLEIVRGMVIKSNKDLKIIEAEAVTGFSYFMGKKRLCKVLKTKRGVVLELNVSLPKDKFKDLLEMETISKAMAHKKHLGTMKHLYRAGDAKQVSMIMIEAVAAFKAEIQAIKDAEKAAEAKANPVKPVVAEQPAEEVVEEVKEPVVEETRLLVVEQPAGNQVAI